jgi:transporter family-2 protein
VIASLLAGGLVAFQPPANAAMSKHVGDLGAALISIIVSFTIIAALLVTVGDPGRLSGISEIRPEHLLGGIAGATVVVVSLIAVKPLGAGAVIALLVAAQLIVGVAIDRFGWFGLQHVGLSAPRMLGVALVITGTVLVTRI